MREVESNVMLALDQSGLAYFDCRIRERSFLSLLEYINVAHVHCFGFPRISSIRSRFDGLQASGCGCFSSGHRAAPGSSFIVYWLDCLLVAGAFAYRGIRGRRKVSGHGAWQSSNHRVSRIYPIVAARLKRVVGPTYGNRFNGLNGAEWRWDEQHKNEQKNKKKLIKGTCSSAVLARIKVWFRKCLNLYVKKINISIP